MYTLMEIRLLLTSMLPCSDDQNHQHICHKLCNAYYTSTPTKKQWTINCGRKTYLNANNYKKHT